jgi:hypothetical protein
MRVHVRHKPVIQTASKNVWSLKIVFGNLLFQDQTAALMGAVIVVNFRKSQYIDLNLTKSQYIVVSRELQEEPVHSCELEEEPIHSQSLTFLSICTVQCANTFLKRA